MIYLGHYEMKPPIYDKFVEKNKCIHTYNMLEMVSCIYTKIFNLMPPLHIQNIKYELNKRVQAR